MQCGVGHIASGPQPVDRAGECELCSTQARDEVATTHLAAFLEHLQHGIRRGVPTLDALCQHRLAGDDAVALEQLQRCGVSRLRG